MKKLLLSLMLLVCMFVVTAKADIFNPIGTNKKYSTFLSSVNSVAPGNILADATAIISYLGVREGEAYQFSQHKWVTTSGATIVSLPWNFAIGATMLNTDGVTGDLDWNVGAYLPVQNVPLMTYTQYLYIIAGSGWETTADGSFKPAYIVGPEFKLTFGSQ